jgi:hypothetical protein
MSGYVISAGMCLSAGVSHLALGVKSPPKAQHIVFALMMAFITPFQLLLESATTATSLEAAIRFTRYAAAMAIGFMVLFGVFICLHTGIRVSRSVAWTFVLINLAFLAYDLLSPRGLVPADHPLRAGPGGPASIVRFFGVPHLVWQTLNLATASWGAAVGVKLALRGQRRQGMVLAVAALVFAGTVFMDLLRNVLERNWTYVGGYGVAAMAIILSAQLALDFRSNEVRLAELLGEALRIRDQLNTPLQSLSWGLDLAARDASLNKALVARLQRSVARLTNLGRSMRR